MSSRNKRREGTIQSHRAVSLCFLLGALKQTDNDYQRTKDNGGGDQMAVAEEMKTINSGQEIY